MPRFALAFTLFLLPSVAVAQVTTRDIIELTRAGLDEEVLLALIEVHRPVFPVDAATLKSLNDAGVAQSVILAMVKSGRMPEPAAEPLQDRASLPPPPPPAPQVVVVEREPRYEIREVAVPVPVYVPVPTRHVRPRPHVPVKAVEPVYWGWGGKLRPDAWRPLTVTDIQPDAKIPPPQRK